jgi:hypothetical protein
MVEVMTRMMTMMETLMVGRPEQTQPPSIPFSGEEPTSFDYDSTPLSPGIEAVISRELEEDQQEVLMKERAALQKRMAELQAEELHQMAQNGSADSSPGPWLVPPDESVSPM